MTEGSISNKWLCSSKYTPALLINTSILPCCSYTLAAACSILFGSSTSIKTNETSIFNSLSSPVTLLPVSELRLVKITLNPLKQYTKWRAIGDKTIQERLHLLEN